MVPEDYYEKLIKYEINYAVSLGMRFVLGIEIMGAIILTTVACLTQIWAILLLVVLEVPTYLFTENMLRYMFDKMIRKDHDEGYWP